MKSYKQNKNVRVKQVGKNFKYLLGLSTVFFSPINVTAQNSNVLAKADTSSTSSLFIVSDEELKTYSNTADLIRELKVLKKDKQSLLDYSKKLREKFKDLEDFYSKQNISRGEGSIANNFAPDILAEKQAELEAVKIEKERILQEIQNLKTEYDAAKLQNASLKTEFTKYKEETALKIGALEVSANSKSGEANTLELKIEELSKEISSKDEILKQKAEEFSNELLEKDKASKACGEQLDQSQQLASKIPEYERQILGLKNELLMKKSAAELFGFDPSSDSKKDIDNNAKVARAEKSRSVRSKRAEIVKQEEKISSLVKREPAPALNSDMMIIEVTGDKVALRAGPGLDNSTIMDVGRGAKLTVEAKENDWFRVNAPTGGRAYVHKDYVKVIDNGKRQNIGTEAIVKSTVSGVKEDFVPMEADPIKPPLPAKPIKRINVEKESGSKSLDSLSMTQESIALQALKKAMNSNSKEFENAAEK